MRKLDTLPTRRPIPAGTHRRRTLTRVLAAALLAPAVPCAVADEDVGAVVAETAARATARLTELGLEELLSVEITSASRKAQRLAATAAAVHVITADDIRRSGAQSIPEALRLAPGVEVARIGTNRWAVSARGFNSRFANKLLILVDGRSVWSPLFSGVFWDVRDTMVEDIERIEVINGPGAAMWGANAVNGVINVITRHSRDTAGGLAVATGGSHEATGVLRWGRADDAGNGWRVWAKNADRRPQAFVDGTSGNDAWHAKLAGARLDRRSGGDSLMITTSVFDMHGGDEIQVGTLAAPVPLRVATEQISRGGHVTARIQRESADGTGMRLQAWIDSTDITLFGVNEERRTIDVDFQHRLRPAQRHDVVWGLGVRTSSDRTIGTPAFSFDPAGDRQRLLSAFAQDEYAVVPDRLSVTAGARVEHHTYTGLSLQPTLRGVWTPDARNTVWAALSRAVRTPSRAERDVTFAGGVQPPAPPLNRPIVLTLTGNREFSSERVTSLEAGWRAQPLPTLSVDVAAFASRYRSLSTFERVSLTPLPIPPLPPFFTQVIGNDNLGRGRAVGLETALDWRPAPGWRWQLAWTLTKVSVSSEPGSTDTEDEGLDTPRHRVSLRASYDPRDDVSLDAWLRRTGAVQGANPSDGSRSVDSYTALDLRAAWRPTRALTLELVGQDLLKSRHLEFVSDIVTSTPTLIERAWFVRATLGF